MKLTTFRREHEASSARRIADQFLLLPILLGFLVSYVLFFLRPIFLNSQHAMIFPAYIPTMKPIGNDLGLMLSYSRSWLVLHQSPYIGANLYPPLATLFFSPLLLLPYQTAYVLLSVCTVGCLAASTVWFPLKLFGGGRLSPTLLLLSVTDFLSYGFQFELERGQFNVIAVSLALLGIALFRLQPRLRPLGYLLFTVSVQLKVYPAILIFAFVEDWGVWKVALARIVGILALNLACLLVLGPNVFFQFLRAMRGQIMSPSLWVGNHSAVSFALQLLPSHAQPLELAILAIFGLGFLYALRTSYVNRLPGLNPFLFLVSFIGALIVPSVSHDYTLSLLVAPVAIFLNSLEMPNGERLHRGLGLLFVFLMSFAYSSTLFSFETKYSPQIIARWLPSFYLQNDLPAIVVVLLAGTGLVALGFLRSHEGALVKPADPSASAP
jgi:uncharacterized membrane protein